jgi:hypothetical protein
MPTPRTLPPIDPTTRAALRQRYQTTPAADLRWRDQLVLRAPQGRAGAELARIVFRRRATVERGRTRFRLGGSAARPRRPAPGSPPTVPPAWEAARLRVIALAPHPGGGTRATWPTGRLAR